MKKLGIFMLLALLTFGTVGTAVLHGQELGEPTPRQNALNTMPAIFVNGRNMQFEFGGNAWIAKVDGENYMAGVIESDDNTSGILTLRQTHAWDTSNVAGAVEEVTRRAVTGAAANAAGRIPGIGGLLGRRIAESAAESAVSSSGVSNIGAKWTESTGPNIVLEYRAGPPATLSARR